MVWQNKYPEYIFISKVQKVSSYVPNLSLTSYISEQTFIQITLLKQQYIT